MNLRNQEQEEPDVNLTPLLDVVFLLLIFFMVTTTFEQQTVVKIDLPESNSEEMRPDFEFLELIIDKSGVMYLNENALLDTSRETLSTALLELAEQQLDVPVTIRADAETPHQYVVLAMDAVAQAGFFNLSIATATLGEE